MSNNEENIFPVQHAYIIYYTEKVFGIITIIFCLFVLYVSIRFQSSKKINSFFQNQITFSCIIHMIPYLLPPQQKGFVQKTYKSDITIICSLEAGLFSLTNFNSVNLPTALTYIVYLSLKCPEKLEKKRNCLKWVLSIVCWFLSTSSGTTVFFFSIKGTDNDLVCWIGRELGIIAFSFIYRIDSTP